MREKKYCLLIVSLLSVFFVQNISAAFLDETELLKLNFPFLKDEQFNMFLVDENQKRNESLAEVLKHIKNNDEKGLKITLNNAKVQFLLAVKRSPDSATYNGLIKVLLIGQDYKQAKLWLKTALAFDENNVETRYLKARLLFIHSRGAEAEVVLQSIIKSNRRYKPAYFTLAEIAVKGKEYSTAEHYYKEMLLLGEKSVNVYKNLAALLNIQNKPEEAAAVLMQGYEFFKGSGDDLVSIAVALSKQYVTNNSPEKALELGRSVFESQPDSLAALDLYLDGLIINKKQNEAEAVLFDRVSKNKNDINSRLKLIILLGEKISNMPRVLALFEEIVSLNKRVPSIYITYAQFLVGNKAYNKAGKLIVRAEKLFPNTSFIDILKAELFSAQGDKDRAAKNYLSAYNKSKSNNLLVKVVQSLNLSGQKAVAIKLLNQEIKISDSTSARMLLAGMYSSGGEYDKAEREYKKILAKNPNHYIALNDLAWLLSQTNKAKEALVLSEKAYIIDPNSEEVKNTYVTILNQLGLTEKAEAVKNK